MRRTRTNHASKPGFTAGKMKSNKRNVTGIVFSFLCVGLFWFGLKTESGKGSPFLGVLFWVTMICILGQFANMVRKQN
jgi:hypothetical protein